jgi:NADPH:quinone reductase-like Zn-dependent oxidoreductase
VRAAVYDRYGPPDVLRIDDVPVPAPAPGQVLVEVAATSVNLSDWEGLRGSPLYARIGGLRSPAHRILGSDIAGRVEQVGEGVTRFRPGDEVYGDNLALMGGFAEYAVAAERALAPKPAGLTFAEASTLPQAGAIALQGTVGAATGRRVLVNGAGGGSGSFAVQLAKRLGAHVTGVDNEHKLDFMPARAVRPRAGPGRPSVRLRVPEGPRPGRPLSLRRRLRTRSAAGADDRLAGRPAHRSPAGRAGRAPRPDRLRAAGRPLPGR